MNLADLFIAKKLAGGGGGGTGTDNYNDLSNKPQINSTSLTGDKSAADLGLQSEINGDNKISADYVDDSTATNKFVTSSEKLTWGGKQDKIDADHKLSSDLVDDTNKTNKFVTSTEKSTWNGKQNAIDSSHKLSSDLVDDTNHTNKFVTSSEKETWNGKQDALTFDNTPTSGSNNPVKSGGIYTELAGKVNTSDIIPSSQGIPASPTDITVPSMKLVADTYVPNSSLVEVVNDGAKNLYTVDNATLSNLTESNGTYTQATTDSKTNLQFGVWSRTTPAGAKSTIYSPTEITENGVLTFNITKSNSFSYLVFGHNGSSIDSNITFDATSLTDGETYVLSVNITNYLQSSGKYTWNNVMICTKSQFDISPTYQPYALPNTVITPELIELCDSGAKNVFNVFQYNTGSTDNGLTIERMTDGRIHIFGTMTNQINTDLAISGTFSSTTTVFSLPSTGYILSVKKQNDTAAAQLHFYNKSSSIDDIIYTQISDSSVLTASSYTFLMVRIPPKTGAIDFYLSIMVCTLAAWNVSKKYVPYRPNWDLVSSVAPFYSLPINHNMIYRGQNLGASLTDAQHTALSSGNFTDLYLGDYWTKSVTIPAGTYTGGDGEEVTVPAQTNITLKAVIADFDTFYAGYASTYAGINTHHAAVIVTGFSNVVWNKTNSTAGGYIASLIHKWLVGSALPQIETWFGSAKVLSHQKLLTNAITGDAASGWAWSSQKISLLSECQLYGMKVWGGSKATNGAYEPGEAFKKLDVFNHIDANLLFGNKNIWCRDIASAGWAAYLLDGGRASNLYASTTWIAPAALILLS